jgi:hypothetical protein
MLLILWIFFWILSLYISVEDLMYRKISLIPYVFTIIILLLISFISLSANEINYGGILIFILAVKGLGYFFKKEMMAPADLILGVMCICICGEFFYLYFMSIGVLTIFMSLILKKTKKLPFVPILCGALSITLFMRNLL